MTRDEKIAAVEKLVSHYKEVDQQFDLIASVFGDDVHEGSISSAVYSALRGYKDQVAFNVCDFDDWLDWFIYENSFGEQGLTVTLRGEKRKCETVSDLIDCIEYEDSLTE